MSKPILKEKAIALRKEGASIGAISKKLSVSKSTVSLWCRNITLSREQLRKIADTSKRKSTYALLRAAEARRVERLNSIVRETELGKRMVGQRSRRDVLMVGLGLYWGEGYKKGSQELGFTNSDPEIICFYIHWLSSTFSITRKDLILRVSINNQHSARIREVQKYWSSVTGIPLTQFTRPSLVRTATSKRYPNHEKHFGTLRIKVRRGTVLRRKILGAISALYIK